MLGKQFVRFFGTPLKPKAKPNSKQPAVKTKMKLNTSGSSLKSEAKKVSTQDRSLPFKEALFEKDNESKTIDQDTLDKREVIEKAWSQHLMHKLALQNNYESKFLISKNTALDRLRLLDSRLYEAAKVIDYSLPPLDRRLPTVTPPKTLPFSCTFDE